MQFLSKLPTTIQGILLILAGFIILLDFFGYTTQLIHIAVLCGAIGLIIWGIITAGFAGKIYRLFKKNKNENQQKPPLQS